MDKKKLLGLYPGYTSVLGPYLRPDGRKHVVLNNSNASKNTKGKTKTISYPKALKEIELNKKLELGETIDHHDRDITNDDLNNLKVKLLSIHAKDDALRVYVKPVVCPICLTLFTPNKAQRNNITNAGPFCSNICSGKYGTNIQNGGHVLPRTQIEKTYYRYEK